MSHEEDARIKSAHDEYDGIARLVVTPGPAPGSFLAATKRMGIYPPLPRTAWERVPEGRVRASFNTREIPPPYRHPGDKPGSRFTRPQRDAGLRRHDAHRGRRRAPHSPRSSPPGLTRGSS